MTRLDEPIVVRRATTGDATQVTAVLVAAFVNGDLGPWLVPTRRDRIRMYKPYFGMLTRHALKHGRVDITGDGKAVAVSYRRGSGLVVPEIVDYDYRLARIFGVHAEGFRDLDAALEEHHPDDVGHWYLQLLAVNPDVQRRGRGSALLDHLHQFTDRLGLPCYLESTGAGPTALYDRHGYQPQPPFRIGRSGPQVFPMWRPTASIDRHPEGESVAVPG
ncbi:GNAT family N-acetyltransferase [Actinoplanes sp. NPDC051470]|uniref:GNAT family N-acetyltransferase n=1 Tax=Actinoplanes sp. NPDC051470 TaxID=3157224 RepID=UPI00342016EE